MMEDVSQPVNEEDGRYTVDDVEKIFNSLLPDEDVQWRDRWGSVYKSSSFASVRQQRRLLASIRKIIDGISSSQIETGRIGVDTLVDLLISDEGIDDLMAMFELLHEDSILKMRSAKKASGMELEDMVSIEEVARAVVPFCIGPLREAFRGLAPALREMDLLQ